MNKLLILLLILAFALGFVGCDGEKVTTMSAITSTPTPTQVSSPVLMPTSTPTPSSTYPPTPNPASLPPTTLRGWASLGGFTIGVLGGGYGSAKDYLRLIDLQQREFNSSEINVIWSTFETEEGNFNFVPSDGDADFAQTHNMSTFGIHLIWSYGIPNWMKNRSFSRDELIKIMNDHIVQVMRHYEGKTAMWSVVNEYQHPQGDVFLDYIGPDYVEIAFKTARETDPSAMLIYNDYDNHLLQSSRTKITKEVVGRLVQQGLIDAVGIQLSIDGSNPPSKDEVIQTMRSYGLPVVVTEFNVRMGRVGGDKDYRENLQAKIYRDMLEACLESGVCNHFYILGIVDRLSIFENPVWPGYDPNADPTPFDDDFQPKPAYFALREVLSDHFQQPQPTESLHPE